MIKSKLIKLIIFFIISINLYSQGFISFPTPKNYDEFLKIYLKNEGLYTNLSDDTIGNLTSNIQIENLFQQWKGTLSFGEILAIARDPAKMLETETNENLILIFGTTMGFLEAASIQIETSQLIANSLKSKISFNANSGNNNGLLIPMHTPIGSFGVNLYVDTPIFDIQRAKTYPVIAETKEKEYDEISDYKSISDAVKYVPIPHLNAYFQINFGPFPMSLTLRGGGAFGFKDLFAKVINDVEV